MQKVKDFIVSLDFAIIVFVLIGLRITFVGASIGDALAIISLVGLRGFNNWLETKQQAIKQQTLSEDVIKQLEDMKTSMSGLIIKNSMRPTSPNSEPPALKKFF